MSTPNGQILIHDSDSDFELVSPFRTVQEIPSASSLEPTRQPVSAQEFLNTSEGQALQAQLEVRHNVQLQAAVAAALQAASAAPPSHPSAGQPVVHGPAVMPTVVEDNGANPSLLGRAALRHLEALGLDAPRLQPQAPQQPLYQVPQPQGQPQPQTVPQAPQRAPMRAPTTVPTPQVPAQADQRLARAIAGPTASLTMPTVGHTSRAGAVRSGNGSESNWTCRKCEKKLFLVKRRGELMSIPLYLSPTDCDAKADPPSSGAPSAKAMKQKDRIPTPPYPWLLPLVDQVNPAPIRPGRTASDAGTATAQHWEPLGPQARALSQLRHLVERGDHTGLLETEEVPTQTSASSSWTTAPTPHTPQRPRQPVHPADQLLAEMLARGDLSDRSVSRSDAETCWRRCRQMDRQ